METKPAKFSVQEPILICNPRSLYINSNRVKVISFMLYEDGHIVGAIQEKDTMSGCLGALTIMTWDKKDFEHQTGINLNEVVTDELIKFAPLEWDIVAVLLLPLLMLIVGTSNLYVLGVLVFTQVIFLFRLLIKNKN